MVDPAQMGGGAPGGAPGGPGGGGGAPGGMPGGGIPPAALLALQKLQRRKGHPSRSKQKAKARKRK
jgi:hypothetical protein